MSALQQRAKQIFSQNDLTDPANNKSSNQTILYRTDLELVILAKAKVTYTIAQTLAVEFVEIPNLEYYI